MGRYLHFLSKTYFKKAGPYINMIFGAGAFLAIMMPLISSANSEGGTGIASISTFTKFFPFLFSTLFSAISVNHIFKEGEIDGSELIIVAKPLTRAQIIITKFMMLFLVIGMYQLLATVTYMIAAASDDFATSEQKMKFVASLAVGGLIVQVIAAMVIVMISSVLGKVGTTVVSILFAAIVPIVSFTLAPLGKGQGFSIIDRDTPRYTLKMENRDINSVTYNGDNVYYNVRGSDAAKGYESYKKSMWYDKAAYGDIWYQWGRFYSMFTDDRNNASLVQKWDRVYTKVEKGNSLTLKIDNAAHDEWVVVLRGPGFEDRKRAIEKYNIGISKMQAIKAHFNSSNMYEELSARLNYIKDEVRSYDSTGIDQTTDIAAVLVENKLEQDPNYNLPTSFSHRTPDSQTGVEAPRDAQGAIIPSTANSHSFQSGEAVALYKVGSMVETLVQKDFISTTAVTLGWSVIAVLLIGGSMIVFFRRDFK